TTFEPVRFVRKTTTDASGTQVTTFVPAEEPADAAWKVRLGHRLLAAALFVLTILVHGAGAVGMGLALAVARGWPRRLLGIGLGFLLLVAVVLPLDLRILDVGHARALEMIAW